MFPECKKCTRAGISTITLALILKCPVDLDKHDCPYLPPDKHTHEEIRIPPQYSAFTITATTSGIRPEHPGIVYFYEDPNREGNKVYLINVSSTAGKTV
jgi:hypothetical protein